MKPIILFASLLTSLTLCSLVYAQLPFEVPLTVTDGEYTMTLYFGILPVANFCIVETDSFNGHIEFELPPGPPVSGVFDGRFVWPRTGSNYPCFGQGSLCDYRPYTSIAQRDTFRVRAQMGAGTSMVFSWPANLAAYFDQLTLRYFNGTVNVDVNMLTNTSVDLTAIGDLAVVRIFSRLSGPGPSFNANPAALAFGGLPVGGSATLPVTVTNGGTANALSISGVSLPAGYTIVPNTFPITVPPVGSQVFNVTFSPGTIGLFSGDLVFTHNAPGNPTSLPVTGMAIVDPPFEVPLAATDGVNSQTLHFGLLSTADFCIVPSDSFNGHVEIFLIQPEFGVFDARFVWPRTGSNPACFDSGSPNDFRPFTSPAQNDTFKVSTQMGTGTSMVLSWPAGLASYFHQLTLRYFDGTGNIDVDMLASTSVDITGAGETASVRIFSGGLIGPGPAFTMNPLSLAFGSVPIGGSSTLPVTVTNRATTHPLLIMGVTPPPGYVVTPNPPGPFPISIGPGFGRTFDVTFSPSAVGQFNGNVIFAHNAGAGSTSLPVTGTGVANGTALKIPLIVTDGLNARTVHFGILPGADFCIVPTDGFAGHFEFMLPPTPPPGVFDARLVWPRSGSNLPCFDQGSYNDFRPYLFAGQRDTFKVRGQLGDGTAMSVSWPAGLGVYFPQLTLRYFDGTGLVNVDMLTDTAANITNAGDPAVALIFSGSLVVGVDEDTRTTVPGHFILYQNYPNPFNPSTTIEFDVPKAGHVTLKVYDLLGREVATLVNEQLSPGIHERRFEPEDLTSGVYFYTLKSGSNIQTRKLIIMR